MQTGDESCEPGTNGVNRAVYCPEIEQAKKRKDFHYKLRILPVFRLSTGQDRPSVQVEAIDPGVAHALSHVRTGWAIP